MRERHVTRQHYEAVERGEMKPEALQRRFREHAMELCPVCDGELQAYLDSKRLGHVSLTALLTLLRRIEGGIDRLEEEARRELDLLLAMKPEERVGNVTRARKRFRNPLLADLLIETSRERVFADPREAAGLARLAFEVALRIDIILPSGEDPSHEPLTRAMAYEANALRAGGDLRAAERSMGKAIANLGKISSPSVRAEIANLAASLRRDQRRFEEGHELIDLAITLHEEAGDRHEAAARMLVKADLFAAAGASESAVQTVKEALPRIDRDRDLRLYLTSEHALACYLADAGHAGEAQARFEGVRSLYELFPNEPAIQLRRRWLEGRIAHGLGEMDRAERCLTETREAFLDREDGFHAALAALDLALLYEAQGRLDDLERLAGTLVPLFRSQDIHREALAALALFVRAASQKAVDRRFIESLATYLRQARHDRALRFEPPTGSSRRAASDR